MNKGLLITLEGIDGSGKSSHIDFIAALFSGYGLPIVTTREPGGTNIGEALREVLLHDKMHIETELLLLFATRKESIENVIRPALEDNAIVISDRYTDSTFAYQGGGREYDKRRIQYMVDWITQGIKPDLTLLFDLEYSIAQQRRGIAVDRELCDRFEHEQREFFNRVRNSYLNLAKAEPDRFIVIDSGKSIADVKSEIQHKVENFIQRKNLKRADC